MIKIKEKFVKLCHCEENAEHSTSQSHYNGITTSLAALAPRNDRKIGFTLAEVLIALGVIGVIAAMTMPSMIKNYQKTRTLSQLKKAYSVLNQAFKMSEIDNDSVNNWSKIEEIGVKDYTNKYWKPYLKVIKVCNNYKNCGYKSNNPWINATKTNNAINGGDGACIVTHDGMIIFFRKYLSNDNATLFVDLNGIKQPNKLGNDLFVFYVNKKGIVPPLGSSIGAYCNKTQTGVDNGVYCSGRIVREGWKISDDYPW